MNTNFKIQYLLGECKPNNLCAWKRRTQNLVGEYEYQQYEKNPLQIKV